MTRIVGLTGGIATGKSTVARMFEARGAVVIDADAIVHELQQPGSPVLEEIFEAFGHQLRLADGSLDRTRLGEHVFQDAGARARLGRILHPRVGVEMARRLAAARARGAPLVLLDIPLLFEGRADRAPRPYGMDAVVLVYAPESAQVERQVARNGYGRDEALRRVRAQLPIEEKRRLADHVIDNSGALEETERQVEALWQRLLAGEPGAERPAEGSS